jgi:hypothetical protein
LFVYCCCSPERHGATSALVVRLNTACVLIIAVAH